MAIRFFIVDAFTEELFGGNPAGVVYADSGCFPAEPVMLKTAAELRYSETAFVRRLAENEFHTRYFTPEAEVDLCGHATIGAFAALKRAGLVTPGSVCKNNTQAGSLDVEILEHSVLMQMGAPVSLGVFDGLNELYKVMGLKYSARADGLLPEIISTGLPDIIMPVGTERELEAIEPDFDALAELSRRHNAVGVHAFTLDAADGHVHCRNFAPSYGIDEEAATGTANGALTYYLYRHGLVHSGGELCFIQGEKMNRPSKILSRISAGASVDIRIGGSAAVLADGEIML